MSIENGVKSMFMHYWFSRWPGRREERGRRREREGNREWREGGKQVAKEMKRRREEGRVGVSEGGQEKRQ